MGLFPKKKLVEILQTPEKNENENKQAPQTPPPFWSCKKCFSVTERHKTSCKGCGAEK